MDQNIKQQIVETVNGTTNVLVTVSSDPTVDELAACIGLTLVLNKLGKHATAVFSGKVPSTLEFLKPEDTLETNTDSLRDFIIALDKSKADKLRYKVEDAVVKIFITPYKTSINQKDLEFSQGDFNVDAVIALGVHKREELDKTIVAHGRILHDATVICINHDQVSNLGVYNWQDAESSSLCEMVVDLAETIQPDNFDAQTATAFLTGIVAETKRFSNEKTSARTMSLSAKLMAAGANQQLVASKLQTNLDKSEVALPDENDEDEADDAGTLRIDHNGDDDSEVSSKKLEDEDYEEQPDDSVAEEPFEEPLAPRQEKRLEPTPSQEPEDVEEDQGQAAPLTPEPTLQEAPSTTSINDVKPDTGEQPLGSNSTTPDTTLPTVKPSDSVNSRLTFQPPQMGGTLTANAQPQGLEPSTDGLSLPTPVSTPILNHEPSKVGENPPASPEPLDTSKPIIDQETITHIEKSVGSDHADVDTGAATDPPVPGVDLGTLSSAAKEAAGQGEENGLEPLIAAGTSPLDMNVQEHNSSPAPAPEPTTPPPPLPSDVSVPSATDIIATTASIDVPTDVPTTSPLSQTPPQTPPVSPNLPPQLGGQDQSLPPEQTASNISQPLPPPVPPPIPPGAFPTPGQPGQQVQQPPFPPIQPQ